MGIGADIIGAQLGQPGLDRGLVGLPALFLEVRPAYPDDGLLAMALVATVMASAAPRPARACFMEIVEYRLPKGSFLLARLYLGIYREPP